VRDDATQATQSVAERAKLGDRFFRRSGVCEGRAGPWGLWVAAKEGVIGGGFVQIVRDRVGDVGCEPI
jgi:hypothetical protein